MCCCLASSNIASLKNRDDDQHLFHLHGSVCRHRFRGQHSPVPRFTLRWRRTLVLWGIIGVIALILWATQLGKKNPPDLPSSDTTSTPLWRSPLAWQVSFFMGLQSFLFYCMIAWLPEILSSQGMSMSMAGWMLFGVQFIGLPATFLAPVLADRFSHQRGIVGGISILYFVGLLGLFASGNLAIAILSVISIGLGQGGEYQPLSHHVESLRANHAKQAAALSGMAQSFGYLLAAIGPILTGFLYDTTHSWTLPILTFLDHHPPHATRRTGCWPQCDGFPRKLTTQKNSHRHLIRWKRWLFFCVVRTVKENGRTLKFRECEFEED